MYVCMYSSDFIISSYTVVVKFNGKITHLGQVHFPLTPLVARAATNDTAPNLAPNFHWIKEVQMIKEFKKYRPWSKLIDDLETL